MQIEWSKRATKNLDAVLAYIHKNNPIAAVKFAADIQKNIANLADHPNLGRLITEFEGVRRLMVHENYQIFYRIKKDIIYIATLRHAKRKPLTRL
jgi:addiction module RelE/StbE family toxin